MFSPRSARLLLCCLAFALSLFLPAWARAQATLLWGVSRGCQEEPALYRALKDSLEAATFPTTQLAGADAALGPEEAAAQLRRACPGVQGRLIGAVLEPAAQGRELERFRVWLYDLGTGQTAYVDDFCKGCNLGERLGQRASFLVDKPPFGAASSTPSYCSPEVATAPVVPRSSKVVVAVYGDPKPRQAIWAAIKRDLYRAGRDAVQWHGESRSFGHAELKHMLQGDPQGQILGVEATEQGASVWVYDGPTDQAHPVALDCGACSKEDLANKVALRGSALLDEAARSAPAGAGAGGAGAPARLPTEACAPLVFPHCGTAGNATPTQPVPTPVAGMDPRLAKMVKGTLWSLFTASAATAVTLFALSGTAAGNYQDPAGFVISRNLDAPAAAMTGIAGVLLGVSIPLTIIVDRAAARHAVPVLSRSEPPSLQCPK